MSQTTETLSAAPEQKGAAATPQNLPTTELVKAPAPSSQDGATPQNLPSELPTAHGRAITAATAQQAAAVGLSICAEARWPESGHDHTPPNLPGFIISSFSPIAAETAARCLRRRPAEAPATAIVIATARGDRQSAAHVARTVAEGGVLGPLLFFQSVPNAVAGHIAARWNLTGPVVCLADPASALEAAALLIEDGDADQALLLRIEQVSDGRDQAHAVLLKPDESHPTTPGAHP